MDRKVGIAKLAKSEKRIYDAVLKAFPATRPETAYNVAIQGGIRFQFIPT